jgi:hypothetical protein
MWDLLKFTMTVVVICSAYLLLKINVRRLKTPAESAETWADDRLSPQNRAIYWAIPATAIAAWTLLVELDAVFRTFGLLAWLAPIFRARPQWVWLFWLSQFVLPIVGLNLGLIAARRRGPTARRMAAVSMLVCLGVEIDYLVRMFGAIKVG